MAFSRALEQKMDDLSANWAGLTKKPMFGGIAYLVNGNMVCGPNKDLLVVRCNPELEAELLAKPYARPMDFTSKPMRGWVFIEPDGWDDDAVLADIVRKAKAHVDTLPPKLEGKSSKTKGKKG